ncbi:MAG: hypothetical protein K0Q43_339 [Ramlibacter sp.]|jgi:hypothetical protein|nr:hypothetical protein [Ramlibacter sp.]
MKLIPSRPVAALLAIGCIGITTGASAQNVKPPKVQLWMDVSTGTMAGMPEMDSMPGMAGMMGGLMGARGPGGGGNSNTTYGMARSMNIMPPRVLDIALHNTRKPGVEAAQAIPAGMRMGESLPLVPPKAQVREREPGEVPQEYKPETPRGRILIYWGCGAQVRAGQPRVIDLARGNPAEFGTALAGRYAPDRGARVSPAYALFPNEKNTVTLARDSSLVGEHKVIGDSIPASMKFTLGQAQDIMPAIELESRGAVSDSIEARWRPVTNARAYFLHAMGQVGEDMVLWSSSETGDTGMGMFDYLPNSTIDRWLKERVLLQPDTTQCAVPKGIFAGPGGRGGDGGMLRMIAYGSESNFAHPPRPADPKAVWEPEWAVRVRVKAHTMAMLGQENERSARGERNQASQPQMGQTQEAEAPSQGGLPIPNPAGILKGLFGR